MSEIETHRGDGVILETPSPKKQSNQLMHWFFTWNNYQENDLETLETLFGFLCHKFCFQQEIGETGTPHIQGVISLKKPMRWTEFGLPKTIHWEKVQNLTKSYEYCSKIETRKPNTLPVTKNYYIPKPLQLITPNKWWQLQILDIIKTEPDDRKVYWFWSQQGGVGKSQFTKLLVAKYNALFFEEGKKADIMHLVISAPEERLRLMVIDVPRDNGNNVSYKSIESIKNGLIYSSKYEGGYKLFNSPHVFIFANEPPQYERLSQDRWEVFQIDH